MEGCKNQGYILIVATSLLMAVSAVATALAAASRIALRRTTVGWGAAKTEPMERAARAKVKNCMLT